VIENQVLSENYSKFYWKVSVDSGGRKNKSRSENVDKEFEEVDKEFKNISVGQGREEIHPLANSTILRNIFEYLDVENLKAVRETCSFRNEEANSLLKSNSKITITWYNHVDRESKPTIETFMKYVESVTPKNVFFRNFDLKDWCLHSGEEEMTQFWLKCGQHIQNLFLGGRYFGFYEPSYVQNVLFKWTPNMETVYIDDVRFLNDPNYKRRSFVKKTRRKRVPQVDETEFSTDSAYTSTLKPMEKCAIRKDIQPNYNLHTFTMEPEHSYPNFPLQWKELFISYPNLKRITVGLWYLGLSDRLHYIEGLLKDLIEFQEENPNKLQNLKRLDLFCPVDYDHGSYAYRNEHFEQAMNLKYKLEFLKIWLNEVEGLSYDTVGKYIAKLSPTLKTLEIRFCNPLTVFPPLGREISFPKLRDLSIDLNALTSNNLDFLEKTPGLEKLTIGNLVDREYTADKEPRLFLNTITILPMKRLHYLHVGEDILTEDCVRRIGEWFPNLSHFGAILDDKLLWAVYNFLCNSVEELDITGKGLTDSGITGMERIEASGNSSEPKPSSKMSQSQEPPVKRRKFNYAEAEDRNYIGTSIGQMKMLRQVTIRDYPHRPDAAELIRLSDDSVYNGFILLTELTYLGLNLRDESITEGALRDLYCCRNMID